MVEAAGKFDESTIRAQPPSARTGSCAMRRWLNVRGTVPAGAATASEPSGPGIGPGKM